MLVGSRGGHVVVVDRLLFPRLRRMLICSVFRNCLPQQVDALAGLGAPADLLAGIRARRYGTPVPLSLPGRIRRGRRTRSFLRAAITQTLEGTPGA